MSEALRIAILHLAPCSGKIQSNRMQIRRGLAIAAGYCAEVAIAPELAESGNEFYKGIYLNTLPCLSYPFLESLSEVANKYDMHILFGRPEQEQTTKAFYNSLTHIDNRGNIAAHYRKQTLSLADQNWATVGTEGIYTIINGISIGLMIGEDGDNEAVIRQYKTINPELIFLATCTSDDQNNVYEYRISKTRFPLVICNSLSLERHSLESISYCLTPYENGYAFNVNYPQVIIVEYNRKTRSFHFVARCRLET